MAKKYAKDWYIALNHWVIGGFAIPVLALIIFSIATYPFISANTEISLPVALLSALVSIIAVWFGAHYSARYMREKYNIGSPNRVLNLSTVYFIAVPLVLGLLAGVVSGIFDAPGTTGQEAVISLGQAVLQTIAFYFASRRQLVR